MSRFQSPLVSRLHPYVPGEQRNGQDVVKLNTNENPYPPSPAVMQAIASLPGDDLRRYPDPEATVVRQALADSEGVSSDQVYVSNGSDETLALAFMAFFTDKPPLQFPSVSYSFYPVYCDLFAIEPEPIAMNADLSLDLTKFTADAGGVCFPNPNAPTGMAVTLADIKMLLKRYTTGVVLIDEAYAGFGAESAIQLIDQYPNLLVTRTFSKGRSLAGLRIGAAFANAELITALAAVKNSFNSYPLDAVAQTAAVASIRDKDYYQLCKEKIIATRVRLKNSLVTRGFSVLPSDANFVFASPVDTPLSASEMYEFLNKHEVLVRYWSKKPISDWLRISVGTDAEVDRLLEVIDMALVEVS